jgi:hypothetical protein
LIALNDRIRNLPADQQKAEIAKFSQSHTLRQQRLYLGRDVDKSVALKLKDTDRSRPHRPPGRTRWLTDDSFPRRLRQGH